MYRGVTGHPCLACHQRVKPYMFLQIRYGTSLILKKILWKVTEEDIRKSITGRRVLDSLGCDKCEMLLAAGDKLGDDFDVKKRLIEDSNEEENDGTIAALYGESVFHSGGQMEVD